MAGTASYRIDEASDFEQLAIYCIISWPTSSSCLTRHTVCSVITASNLTPDKHDDWNVSRVCLSHARPTQDTPSIAVMK